MKLQTKKKIINGKEVMGVIDENLNTVIPFKFENIILHRINHHYGNHYDYFICIDKNGYNSLYNEDGTLLISSNNKYTNLTITSNERLVIAEKDGQIGLLSITNSNNKKFEIVYEFGKCDEILDEKEGIKLIKHTKKYDKIGYYYNNTTNEKFDPKYISYEYMIVPIEFTLPHKSNYCYYKADKTEYQKLSTNIELILYSKYSKGKIVYGLKQKVEDLNSKSYEPEYIYEDVLEPIYKNITIDKKKQLIFFEKEEGKTITKGFIGFAGNWNLSAKGVLLFGHPTLEKVINVDCIYSDINLIDDNHTIVKDENDKYGLITFSFGKTIGDWNYYGYKNYNTAKIITTKDKYDSIASIEKENHNEYFIGDKNSCKELITDHLDINNNRIIIGNNYKDIKALGIDTFLCTNKKDKKQLVYFTSDISKYQAIKEIYKSGYVDDINVIKNDKDKNTHFIELIKENKRDLYYRSSYYEKLKTIEENINSASFKDNFLIVNNDSSIKYYNNLGYKVFDSTTLQNNNQITNIEYLPYTERFLIEDKNGLYLNTNEDKLLKSYQEEKTSNGILIYYSEEKDNKTINTLSKYDVYKNEESELLKGNFILESLLLDGRRAIISINKQKYGVIETGKGNVCIDAEYDEIKYDEYKKIFICKKDEDIVAFDIDGFINEKVENYVKKLK